MPLLSGAAEVRFEIVPGGHLGMLTGRAARATTWRVLDEWVGQWSTDDEPAPTVKKAASEEVGEEDRRQEARDETARLEEVGRQDGCDQEALARPRRDRRRTRPVATARRARAAWPAETCLVRRAPLVCLRGCRLEPAAVGAVRLRLRLGGHRRVRDRPGADAAALPHRQPRDRGGGRGLHRVRAEGVGRGAEPDRRPDQRPDRRPPRPAAAVAAARRALRWRSRSRCCSPRRRWARR